LSLAAKLNRRLTDNAKIFKNANENMLFLLTALTLEDSLQDLSNQVQVLQKKVGQEIKLDDKDLDQVIESLADRLDALSKLMLRG
jgi:hypothetical protein